MSAIPRNSFDASLAPAATQRVSLLRTVALSVARSVTSMFRFWSYRRSMTELVTLDDHMLKDIGITRGDVRQGILQPYSDDPTTRLRIQAMERQSSDMVWTRNAEERRLLQSRRRHAPNCETYRSGKQPANEMR